MTEAFTELINAVSERDEGDKDGDGQLSATEASSLWAVLQSRLKEEFKRTEGRFARLMYGHTAPETRRLLQLAFNRPNSNPRVLVAQSVVGREGLNLHKACKTVVLLHPEWNPGVVEQQIGRIDRVGSLWETQLEEALGKGVAADDLPHMLVRPVVFKGTYDEKNWEVLRGRWDDLRAQLHGVVISPHLSESFGVAPELAEEINRSAPSFSPIAPTLCIPAQSVATQP
ncbi:helicase-like protein [Sphaerotilus hippei]|uniref:Helicase-like protein n=2 Tax=Sphaerotilus hippei TaxID=744406 RepID=A0A318GUS3_9BURK|nr:helicase-like protein [Sphaerotilus hippei]